MKNRFQPMFKWYSGLSISPVRLSMNCSLENKKRVCTWLIGMQVPWFPERTLFN